MRLALATWGRAGVILGCPVVATPLGGFCLKDRQDFRDPIDSQTVGAVRSSDAPELDVGDVVAGFSPWKVTRPSGRRAAAGRLAKPPASLAWGAALGGLTTR